MEKKVWHFFKHKTSIPEERESFTNHFESTILWKEFWVQYFCCLDNKTGNFVFPNNTILEISMLCRRERVVVHRHIPTSSFVLEINSIPIPMQLHTNLFFLSFSDSLLGSSSSSKVIKREVVTTFPNCPFLDTSKVYKNQHLLGQPIERAKICKMAFSKHCSLYLI